MKVKNTLSALDYVKLADEIADGYFYSDGTYKPAVGRINTMWLYYKYCVVDSELDDQVINDNNSLDFVEILAANNDFCNYFENAISSAGHQFEFSNAYYDAMKMVEQRLNPMSQAANSITNMLTDIVNQVSNVFTEENIETLSAISKQISDGQNLPEAIIQQYIKSGQTKKIIDLLAQKDK